MFVNRACAVLSRKFAARVVCCSAASLRVHRNLNYAAEKLELIPNGFDLNQVKPDPTARVSVRQELGIPTDALLIGIAARFHPLKTITTSSRLPPPTKNKYQVFISYFVA